MLLWVVIKVALKSLWGAKLRSFLAILGVIIGVGAVIAMLAIVEGGRRQMQEWIVGMGTDVLFVWPDYRSVQGKGANPQLKLDDAYAMLHNAAAVRRVSPSMETSGSLKFFSRNTRTQISGVAPSYLAIRNMTVEFGRAFTEGEVDQAARVAVLGPKTARKLFGAQDPVGQTIKIDRLSVTVIGVFKSKGGSIFGNEDSRVVMPYTTVRQTLTGHGSTLGSIVVQAWSTPDLRQAEEQIKTILRKRHHIKPQEKDDFGIFNQAELLEGQKKAVNIFRIVLGGVGGICLLTGGIGIMNIMLVTVTERTREIGLRKAIGAKSRDILGQFLFEAVLMSALGGLLGIALGSGFAWLVSAITPLKTVVALENVLLAMVFAAAVGIFFGYYPAHRAARLDPIEALRFE